MDTFVHSSFGTVVMTLFQGIFTAPSWQTFTALACGWALAGERHTITTYMWLTGAATVKHFSRFYVFLGCPLYHKRWQLWGAVIRLAAQWVPAGEVIRVSFDDTTKKKVGTHIEGLARYRNGAGSARQEYRTLRGVNFVLGIMHIPLQRWPGHYLSVPIGCELYLKAPQAHTLNMPYQSRSQLARTILDFVAEQLPGRSIRSLADGGYATKDYIRQLPKATHVVRRFPISAKLYELPPPPTPKRRGAPRKKGDLIGSPKTLAQITTGWAPHPSEAGAEIHAWDGLWHAVVPGRLVRVVVLRRTGKPTLQQQGQRKPPPAIEAFFTSIRLRRDSEVSVRYAEGLNSGEEFRHPSEHRPTWDFGTKVFRFSSVFVSTAARAYATSPSGRACPKAACIVSRRPWSAAIAIRNPGCGKPKTVGSG